MGGEGSLCCDVSEYSLCETIWYEIAQSVSAQACLSDPPPKGREFSPSFSVEFLVVLIVTFKQLHLWGPFT